MRKTEMESIKNYLAILGLVCLWSCEKSTITPEKFVIRKIAPEHITLYDIAIGANGEIVVVGGDSWYRGMALESEVPDGDWSIKEMGSKAILSITYDSTKNRFVAAGIDGHIFIRENSQNWQFIRTTNWDVIHSIKPYDERYVGVGGGGFGYGNFFIFDLLSNEVSALSFPRELRDIYVFNDGQMLACGFSDILKCNIAPECTWEYQQQNGNYFSSLSFSNDSLGFVCSFNGKLFKTTNKGENWSELKTVGNINRSRESFNDVFSLSPFLIVVGDGGLVRLSNDDGKTWEHIDTGLNIDFQSAMIYNKKALIVGSQGFLVSFEL